MELQALKTSKVNLKFSGFISSNSTVKIDFNILPGSRAPGYFAAIWQGALVQSFHTAFQIHQIKNHQPSGTLKFNSLQLGKQDYIIGFGFSSNRRISICRTLYIPATPRPFQTLSNLINLCFKDELLPDQGINLFMPGNFNPQSMRYLY
ncbi:hypothetical protein DBR43_00180 [Pedobacter sp. KBW06]|uniref:hypothetical protein n=1 Tax=Pedobacter sp. KBW06 TaxID=2153359 RepID=UPI000F5B3364|nr:hypothetical protein [Pedobacter sp. KBW06]RQO73863.1 hypothetical protein DBR43_00180 [Pedobacter sp. KBW06]